MAVNGLLTVLKIVCRDLSDIDQDGGLDSYEYTVALCLCEKAREGEAIPDELPKELVPPGKQKYLPSK